MTAAPMKRLVDILVSLAGLIILLPLLLVIAVIIKLESPGPIFFKQQRVGKDFRPFLIYKFRTMISRSEAGRLFTVAGDPRVTRVGAFLRKAKLDELPQLMNVLRGEMTLVGPRPEVPRYVEAFRRDYEEILTVRPGLTDLASLKYRDEASLLARSGNPEQEYLTCILPDKIDLGREYIRHSSLAFDLRLILKTLQKVLFPGSAT